jgi:hypothetical protein
LKGPIDVLVSSKQVVVKAPLPQIAGDISSQSSGNPALEEAHEVDQRPIDVEHQKVHVIRHDAEAENSPVIAVEAIEFNSYEICTVWVCKNGSAKGAAGSEKCDRARLRIDGLVETDRFAESFLRWHRRRVPGVIRQMNESHRLGGGKPRPYDKEKTV